MKTILTLIFAALFSVLAPAQKTYKNIIFEGGGIRGIAYGGVLHELDSLNMLHDLERVGGTSVGAIQAALLAVGYSPDELIEVIAGTKMNKFSDGRGFFIGGTKRTMKYYGWYRGDRLSDWIGELIAVKTGNADMTFGELHALVGTKPDHRDLYVTATNLSLQRVEVLSHENFPNMKIRDGVRISMSIPIYFQAVFLNTEGEIVKKPKDTRNLWVMVDGGIVANYPIHIFDQAQYVSGGTLGDTTQVVNWETLGVRLERDEQIPYDEQNQGLAPFPIEGFVDYIGAFYNLVLEMLNRRELTDDDWSRTVMVSCAGIGPKIKKMSQEQKQLLIDSGRAGTRNFLN
jgi:NTE family protein